MASASSFSTSTGWGESGTWSWLTTMASTSPCWISICSKSSRMRFGMHHKPMAWWSQSAPLFDHQHLLIKPLPPLLSFPPIPHNLTTSCATCYMLHCYMLNATLLHCYVLQCYIATHLSSCFLLNAGPLHVSAITHDWHFCRLESTIQTVSSITSHHSIAVTMLQIPYGQVTLEVSHTQIQQCQTTASWLSLTRTS